MVDRIPIMRKPEKIKLGSPRKKNCAELTHLREMRRYDTCTENIQFSNCITIDNLPIPSKTDIFLSYAISQLLFNCIPV